MHIKQKRIGLRRLRIITKVGILYLFVSLGISLISTIWAIYLESFFHKASSVGFLTSFFTVVGILSYLLLIPIVEKRSKTKLLFISLLFFAISYFILSVYSNIYVIVIFGVFLAFFSSLRVTAFGLLVRDKTNNKSVSKNEGFVYTLLNIAWLVGPLIAGYILRVYGFGSVFLIASLFVLISLFIFHFFKIKDNRKSKNIDHNLLKIIFEFFSKKSRVFAYVLSGAVNLWWALIYIYIPIYIIESGYGGFLVGLFLSGIVVPLILFEYYFGKLAGKKGFKKLFFIGFIFMAVLVILCFFISNIYIILFLLITASIGVSMIESTTEAYFFDIIKIKERDKYYGVYNTAVDVGNLVGILPAALILVFFPFKSIFLFFGLMMIIFSIISLKIKDAYEFRRT